LLLYDEMHGQTSCVKLQAEGAFTTYSASFGAAEHAMRCCKAAAAAAAAAAERRRNWGNTADKTR